MSRTIEFDMQKHVTDLCGFIRGENALGGTIHTHPNDPDTFNAGYEAKVDEETKRLLREPIELVDADIEHVLAIYKNHPCDMCDLGETLHRYMTGLAQEQAKELVNSEYE